MSSLVLTHNDNDYVPRLYGNVIPAIKSLRSLGFLVDSNLSLDQHCLSIVRMPSRLVNSIFKNFKTCNVGFLVGLVSAIVPPLDYCRYFKSVYQASLWFKIFHLGCVHKLERFRLETLQK